MIWLNFSFPAEPSPHRYCYFQAVKIDESKTNLLFDLEDKLKVVLYIKSKRPEFVEYCDIIIGQVSGELEDRTRQGMVKAVESVRRKLFSL